MTDAPELESLFDPIRKAMADMDARALRLGHIETTIRVNAMWHGATDAQIDEFIAGRVDFIGWVQGKVEGHAAALPAAQVAVKPLAWSGNTDYRTDGIIAGDCIGFWTVHRSDDLKTYEWADPYGKTTFGFSSQKEAIAALERERAARIRAALDVAPAPDVAGLVEAVRTQAGLLIAGTASHERAKIIGERLLAALAAWGQADE